ncbi:MAG: phosphoribosylaminoimidazolesuccinocarboxamide synthase [Candidatus Thorarchaeota archaeon]|nr:phosphoribosylaminoimidazolesuccinocarboxamide synthase [Candidatus Thorarchaeota archaeon]
MKLIHKGKVKRVLEDPESKDRVVIEFTDTVTAGDGAKKQEFTGKGKLACDFSEFLFGYLEGKGIDTHFIKRLKGPQLMCTKVEIFPIEFVCRNLVAGSFSRRYGTEKGTVLDSPLVEYFMKNDDLHDPLITGESIIRLGLVSQNDLEFMTKVTLSVNYYLSELLKQQKLTLVDFKLEFGKAENGEIVLADEISPDTMRVWDATATSLDKDVFREDKGDLIATYEKLLTAVKTARSEDVEARLESVYIIVEPKPAIKNPPGEVTRKALIRLGFAEVEDVRMGKVFNITLKKPLTSEILKHLEVMNVKLLSNPISEKHKVRFE